jgi:formylglycine-generating enzyme required for sulfatase activity
LSRAEKIAPNQWCYEPNAMGQYAEGMRLKANWRALSGYRLPREAEWEHACRAGTVTAWTCGSDGDMLGHYAWYAVNSGGTAHPSGSLKPNGLGLFDPHGNAWQWCQEVAGESSNKDNVDINDKDRRVSRGGSWLNYARACRAADRGSPLPDIRLNVTGLRPCFRLN